MKGSVRSRCLAWSSITSLLSIVFLGVPAGGDAVPRSVVARLPGPDAMDRLPPVDGEVVIEKPGLLPHALWTAPPQPLPAAPPAPAGPPPAPDAAPRSRSLASPQGQALAPTLTAPLQPLQPLLPLITDRLTSQDGSLDVPVVIYSDCSGTEPLTRAAAALDPCVPRVRYFLGHNPGVFSPLMHMGEGSVITWHDHSGTAHLYRVVAARQLDANAPRTLTRPDVTAQFQACLTLDGSVDRLLDAVGG